jgi:hypothetical protein
MKNIFAEILMQHGLQKLKVFRWIYRRFSQTRMRI